MLGGFPQGKAEVDVQGQGQGHDMSIVLVEFQGGGVLRQGVQVHD